jgi:hypothetical protein
VQRLLTSASEDERVTTLESHDSPTGGGVLDEEGVDLLLGHRMCAGALADIQHEDVRVEVGEDVGGTEPIGDNDIPQQQSRPPPADGQPWVAGSATHEVTRPGFIVQVRAAPDAPEGRRLEAGEDRVAHRSGSSGPGRR